ncbi:hypothetical protein JTB14_026256 [Gonioctena quinquepunctata]|nr:hypothetical protein JTB14_026256 [Gonioctena quinquepunctata]
MSELVSYYHPPAESWDIYFKLALLVLLVFFCQIRELKHMVPLSFIANATLVVAFGITLYYMAERIRKVDIRERNLATSISSMPSYFSTVLFAMEGIGSIMPVENTMVESKFLGSTGVLNAAMGFVVCCHTCIGFCGYYAFGEETNAAITQNLPSDEVPAQVVQACISASMFFTFMLNHYVPTDIVWRRLRPRIAPEKHNLAQIVLRTSTVTCTMAVAAAAGHNLDSLIDLVGAVFFSLLGLFVPAIADILINWGDWGACGWKLYKNIALIFLSMFALISGTFYAVSGFMK